MITSVHEPNEDHLWLFVFTVKMIVFDGLLISKRHGNNVTKDKSMTMYHQLKICVQITFLYLYMTIVYISQVEVGIGVIHASCTLYITIPGDILLHRYLYEIIHMDLRT